MHQQQQQQHLLSATSYCQQQQAMQQSCNFQQHQQLGAHVVQAQPYVEQSYMQQGSVYTSNGLGGVTSVATVMAQTPALAVCMSGTNAPMPPPPSPPRVPAHAAEPAPPLVSPTVDRRTKVRI
jgi:hypothetical protein